MLGGELFIILYRVVRKCILKDKVAKVLRKAYNKEGYFIKEITLCKLREYH